MKKAGLKILLSLIILALQGKVVAQSSEVKSIYLFPNNFYEESTTNLNEVRLIWNSEPEQHRFDDCSEELRKILDKKNLLKMMNDPVKEVPPPQGYNYRLYCIITYSMGVNVYEDTTNIYIGFSPQNYMTMEFMNEKKVLETDYNFLLELNELISDKYVRKSVKKKITEWKQN